MKLLMKQALEELDRLFYTVLSDNLSTDEKIKCEEKFDYIYEKLETMINAMEV